MPARFDPEVLGTLDRTDEVKIEPLRNGSSAGRRTIVWIVVEGDDAYVRSYRGAAGRWYKNLTSEGRGVLHARGLDLPVRAVPATDDATVSRISEGFRQKYEQRWPGETAAMVREEVLPTTLRLEPA